MEIINYEFGVWGIKHLYSGPVWSRLKACTFSSPTAGPLRKDAPSWCRAPFEPEGLLRKLVHASIGLVFMLCWPLFSSAHQGALFAALVPGAIIITMLLMGLGIWKDEATVKSMSRFGDYR